MTTDPYEPAPGASAAIGGERPSEMATLLEEGLDSYRSPQRGEIVPGTVMGWDREGLLVDIGAKSEGVVPKHEMQSLGPDADKSMETGQRVMVMVLQPESHDGPIMLSVDKARGERGWLTLQEKFDSGEIFEAAVTGYNKGGLLVNIEGVNAFVPLSQVVGFRPDRNRDDGGSGLAEAVGRPLRLKVIEINRRRNRAIVSERAALQEWRAEQKERLIQELHEGDIRRGRITSVRNFGVFVDLGGADGLAHLSELTWERDKSPTDLFHVGDEVDVYITKIDAENKKIALSLRRARPEQWDAIVDKYKEGQVVAGMITKLVTFGAFARIEGPVEGLIHVSELVDRRIGHPKEVVREGDLLPLKIVRIERDRHRLGLSLRRARDEGETLGFVFSDGGEVLSVPSDVREEFEAREGPLITPSEDSAPEAALPGAPTAEPRAQERAPAAAPREAFEDEPPTALGAAFTEAMPAAQPAAELQDEPTALGAAFAEALPAAKPFAELQDETRAEDSTPAAEAVLQDEGTPDQAVGEIPDEPDSPAEVLAETPANAEVDEIPAS